MLTVEYVVAWLFIICAVVAFGIAQWYACEENPSRLDRFLRIVLEVMSIGASGYTGYLWFPNELLRPVITAVLITVFIRVGWKFEFALLARTFCNKKECAKKP